jgi:hypothetical protein
MTKNLPKTTLPYIEPLPADVSDENVLNQINKFRKLYGDNYVNSIIWTVEDAKNTLDKLGVPDSSSLFWFCLNAFELPDTYRSEELFGLSQVRDDFNNPFWGDKFNNIEMDFLLLSSVEGEYSYFYDKRSDSVFGVGWDEMEKLVNGSIEPLFASSFDFLDWYFSSEDE